MFVSTNALMDSIQVKEDAGDAIQLAPSARLKTFARNVIHLSTYYQVNVSMFVRMATLA